jgi:hypothetical protein
MLLRFLTEMLRLRQRSKSTALRCLFHCKMSEIKDIILDVCPGYLILHSQLAQKFVP